MVFVLACAAAVGVAWVAHAADKKDAPAGQTVRGRLVAKTDLTLDVRAEDEKDVHRYMVAPPGARLGPKITAFVKSLTIESEVQLVWRPEWGGRHVTEVTVLGEPGKSGKLVGTVTNKSNAADPAKPAGWLEIKDDEGKTQRYSAPWAGNGPDPVIMQAMGRRNIGDRIEFRWYTDDHVRLSTVRVLAISADAAKQPGFDGGTVVGQVIEKGRDFIVIKPDDGDKERYLPQRVIGEKDALDKDVLRAIANAKVGDRVEARWFRDGERRLYFLAPASAVKPPETPRAQPGPGGMPTPRPKGEE